MSIQTLNPDEFWLFSLNIYALQNVKKLCLTLQDQHGADVNLLLLALYADSKGITVVDQALDALLAVSADWQENKLAPMRLKRQSLDRDSPAYQQVLREELELEKKEQTALLSCILDPSIFEVNAPPGSVSLLAKYGTALNLPANLLKQLSSARTTRR